MGLEFHEEKDLTGTYKQLKKIIASALGEEEFETITNTDVKVVGLKKSNIFVNIYIFKIW